MSSPHFPLPVGLSASDAQKLANLTPVPLPSLVDAAQLAPGLMYTFRLTKVEHALVIPTPQTQQTLIALLMANQYKPQTTVTYQRVKRDPDVVAEVIGKQALIHWSTTLKWFGRRIRRIEPQDLRTLHESTFYRTAFALGHSEGAALKEALLLLTPGVVEAAWDHAPSPHWYVAHAPIETHVLPFSRILDVRESAAAQFEVIRPVTELNRLLTPRRPMSRTEMLYIQATTVEDYACPSVTSVERAMAEIPSGCQVQWFTARRIDNLVYPYDELADAAAQRAISSFVSQVDLAQTFANAVR